MSETTSRIIKIATKKRYKNKYHWTDYFSYFYLFLGVLLMFGPVVWLGLSSLKTLAGIQEYPPTILPLSQIQVNVEGYDKPLPIYAKGQNSREWIHVEDHCDALYKIFKKGKIGESYNVGSNINLENINLVKTILKIFKKRKYEIGKKVKIIYVKDRPGHDFRYALNSNKIRKQIGWKSKISLIKGLNMTIDWYLNNKSFINSISKKLYVKRFGLKL